MQANVVRMGHIGMVVSDLDRTVDFYTQLVGLRLTERFEYGEQEIGHGVSVAAGAFVRCDGAHHCISIFTLRDDGNPSNGDRPLEGLPDHGLHHIAFELATPEDLLAKRRQFKDAGVTIASERRGGPGNQPRFYIRDPDGNLLEFYWGIDQVGWDGRPRAYEPIQEVDLEHFDFERYVNEREQQAALAGHSR